MHVLANGCTLRRPFSICEVVDEEIKLVFQIKGYGTKQLACANVTNFFDLIGPLGNGFSLRAKNSNSIILQENFKN